MVAIANYATDPSLVVSEPMEASRKALLSVATLIAKFTDRHSHLAILADVRLDAHEGRQRFTATDLNCYATFTAPLCGAPVAGVTVSAKLLVDMLKSATGDKVTLAKSGAGLTVASNGADATLMGTNRAHDFPKIPEVPECMPEVDGAIVRSALDRCLHAVCKDETRFHLNGIYIEHGETFVATDGHRLIKVRTDAHGVSASLAGTGILPARAAKLLAEILKTCDTAHAAIRENMLHVTGHMIGRGEWAASFKLIDAQFPPYRQVIPTTYERLVTVNRKALVGAMKRAKALCTETRGALVKVADGKLHVIAEHPDNGTTSEALKAESAWVESGDTCTFGVNAGYLLDALDEIECEHVTIAIGKEGTYTDHDGHSYTAMLDPILVRGTEDQVSYSVENAAQISVIMPMRI